MLVIHILDCDKVSELNLVCSVLECLLPCKGIICVAMPHAVIDRVMILRCECPVWFMIAS